MEIRPAPLDDLWDEEERRKATILEQFEQEIEPKPEPEKRAYDPRLPTRRDYSTFCEPDGQKRVFVRPRLGRAIAEAVTLTRGPGGGLWYDAGGYFVPGGEDLVRECVQEVLQDEFKGYDLNEVMTWCKALPVTISAEPGPENRLNCANGVLDLDTLGLRAAQPSERFTYKLPVAWNLYATCPAADAFVREVVPADCFGIFFEILGLCLLQTGRFRRAVMFLGKGANGKTRALRLFNAVLGSENTVAVPLQVLAENRFAAARLFGKLANIAGDLDSRPLERSDLFKTLTGDDRVHAERKYENGFDFVNTATLVFSANEWPVSHDQSDAYFTRWTALPFPNTYVEGNADLKPGERRADPRLLEKLTTREELEGVLVRAVQGARQIRERGGFDVPESVRAAVADYREWADTVLAWVIERVRPLPEFRLSRRQFYDAYRTWVTENGRSPVSSKRFWPRLREVLTEGQIAFREVKSDDWLVLDVTV